MGPAWGQPAREHAHSLTSSHTSETSLFVCVRVFFGKGGAELTLSDGDTVQIIVKSFQICLPPH